MEKIIFFGLVIPIIAYVLYLGATAIMEGFKAKEANRAEKEEVNEEGDLNSPDKINTLSEELEKLNNLRESGVITQEEFEKAKSKLLDN
jgi:multidrug resistance efflux pump|tara:strand:- start:3 stop:269 length:267 start_codon:yes stop_codon:yes gene_type:complete